jgi:dihydrofolate synthase/folylpolyglutamate synthase
VLAAPVVVLTNVGLEHTRWLGPTIPDIAREKLAVVPPGATLVVGSSTSKPRRRPAHARRAPGPGAETAAPSPLRGFQRTNFAVARAAARPIWAHSTRPASPPPRAGWRCRAACSWSAGIR